MFVNVTGRFTVTSKPPKLLLVICLCCNVVLLLQALVGYGIEDPTSWSCDGTLISERFVMTAGICSRASDA